MTIKPATFALTAAYVLVYWSLTAFGRDVLFNHNVDADLADDRIGAVLPYIRVAACACATLTVVATSSVGWTLSRLPMSLVPFCLWTLLTVAWTDSAKDTLRGSFTLLAAWAAVPILLHRIGVVGSARLLLHLIVIVCVVSFLVAICLPSVGRHSAGDLVQGAHDGLWRGIFSHKNGLGPWAAYGAVLPLLYGAIGMRRWVRIVGSMCALACLIFAGSATAIALAGLCIVLHIGFRALRSGPTGAALIVAAAVIASACLVSVPLLAALGRSTTLSGRGPIWSFAWDYVIDSPWLGYGYATLGGYALRAREEALFAQAIPGPESGYLALLLETGLAGCVLLLAAYIACLAKGLVWLKRSAPADKRAVEFYLMILITTLAEAVTESNAFVVTGYDGVLFFTAMFALSTARSPPQVTRQTFRCSGQQERKRDDHSDAAPAKCDANISKIGDHMRRHTARLSAGGLRARTRAQGEVEQTASMHAIVGDDWDLHVWHAGSDLERQSDGLGPDGAVENGG